MKLRIMTLLSILLPFCANAVTLSAGYEYKDLKNEYKLRDGSEIMKTKVTGEFNLLDLYVGFDNELEMGNSYLGIGYKTDIFSSDAKLTSRYYVTPDYNYTGNKDAGYDELYIVWGGDFSENVFGQLKFNYSKFEKDYSPSLVDSDESYKYKNGNYGLEGKVGYKVVSDAYIFGIGAGLLLETGENKEYFKDSTDTESAKFDYWNLGCLFDVSGAYAFTPSLIGKLGYEFKYSRDISVSGEKDSEGDPISAGSNERIDNSFSVNLAYKF